MSAFVKGFGCRPHDGGAARTGAGVRKPPMRKPREGIRKAPYRASGLVLWHEMDMPTALRDVRSQEQSGKTYPRTELFRF